MAHIAWKILQVICHDVPGIWCCPAIGALACRNPERVWQYHKACIEVHSWSIRQGPGWTKILCGWIYSMFWFVGCRLELLVFQNANSQTYLCRYHDKICWLLGITWHKVFGETSLQDGLWEILCCFWEAWTTKAVSGAVFLFKTWPVLEGICHVIWCNTHWAIRARVWIPQGRWRMY